MGDDESTGDVTERRHRISGRCVIGISAETTNPALVRRWAAELLTAADRSEAAPGAVVRDVESGWLIEQGGATTPLLYWTGFGWSIEHLDAVRFARKIDAERAHTGLALKVEARVVEHEWYGPVVTR